MQRDIIIGDIHGCYDELLELLAELAVTDDDRVISVGDLVDRGPKSFEAWKFFEARRNSVVLMGNHERKHVRGVLSYSQEIVRLQFGDQYEAFRRWAAKLPYFLETPDALVVHGGFEDGVSVARQREDVLSGTTSGSKHLEQQYGETYWPEVYSGERPLVFGHHVVGPEPKRYATGVVGIDTGACHGGFLTALVIPGFRTHSVKAKRNYWTEEQIRWQVPVLQSKPWGDFPFTKFERELAELRRRTDPDVQRAVQQLESWRQGVSDQIPGLMLAVAERVHGLRSKHEEGNLRKSIAAEPFPQLLFASHAGTLDERSLRTVLPSPYAILQAASAYGVGGNEAWNSGPFR